jgi:hypothetical protein
MIKVYRLPSRSIGVAPAITTPALRMSRSGVVQNYTRMSLVVKILAEAGYDCEVTDNDVSAFILAGYYSEEEMAFHLAAQTEIHRDLAAEVLA